MEKRTTVQVYYGVSKSFGLSR